MAQAATTGELNVIRSGRAGSRWERVAEDVSVSGTVDPPRSQAHLDRIADEEHVENIARSRLVWSIGVAGAAGLSAIEIGYEGVRGPLLRFIAPRLLLIVAPALAVLRCHRISAVDLRAVDATVYATAAASLALIAAQTGGFESAAMDAVTCVIVAQGLTLLNKPRAAALRLGVTMAVFALVTGLIIAFGPDDISGALQSPDSLASLGRHVFLQSLLGATVIAAGHTHWSARRTAAAMRTAGRYVLHRCIGRGGMGEVWLGHLPSFQRDVAVKLVRADLVTPQAIARFGREVGALAELKHPNTVQILDWGVSDGNLYYAMELLSGETLKALVLREGALSPERAVRLGRQVAQALAEAHELGVVHRDLKPDNLFLLSEPKDFLKVLDFGVAKVQRDLAESPDASITRMGMVVGTAAYMAPEQVLSQPITPATDVYALGGVLFFMLTGRAPFVGPFVDVMRAQIQSPAPSVAQVAKTHVPPALVAVVRKCLEKSPRHRYSSMLDLDAALRNALLEEEAPPALEPPKLSDPPTTRRTNKSRSTTARTPASIRPPTSHRPSITGPNQLTTTVRYPRRPTPARPSLPPPASIPPPRSVPPS